MRLSVTSNPRMRFSVECAFPHLGKRGAGSRKSAFWQADSRKSAVWPAPPEHTSRKSALWPRPRGAPHQKTHSGWGVTSRMRLSVTSNPQNALFRKMRFFSPAQTWRRLTEKRILAGRLTEKRTLATATSRKSAPCTSGLTEKRTLAAPPGRTSRKGAFWLGRHL